MFRTPGDMHEKLKIADPIIGSVSSDGAVAFGNFAVRETLHSYPGSGVADYEVRRNARQVSLT